MENEEALWEEEQNFCKVFYNMAEKVDKLFSGDEKTLGHEKQDVNENRSKIIKVVEKSLLPLLLQVIVLITLIVIPNIKLRNHSSSYI